MQGSVCLPACEGIRRNKTLHACPRCEMTKAGEGVRFNTEENCLFQMTALHVCSNLKKCDTIRRHGHRFIWVHCKTTVRNNVGIHCIRLSTSNHGLCKMSGRDLRLYLHCTGAVGRCCPCRAVGRPGPPRPPPSVRGHLFC